MAERTDQYHEKLSKAHHLARAARWSDAAQAYRQAVEARPGDAAARLCLALSLYQSGDLNSAYKEYESVLNLLPKDTLVLTRMAEIQHTLGNATLATDLFLRLAEIHLERKQREKALAVWQRTIDTYAGDVECLERLEKACVKAGEKKRAAEVDLAIALVHAEVADQKRAVRACRRAIDLDGTNENARRMLRSLENGTSEWRSLRLLEQFSARASQPEDLASSTPQPSGYAGSPLADQQAAGLSGEPESQPEVAVEEKEQSEGPARTTEWFLAEARRFWGSGDIVCTAEVLCAALENGRGREKAGTAAIGQYVNSLLSHRQQLDIEELVRLPFEGREAALRGVLEIDGYVGQGREMAAVDACLGLIERLPEFLPAQTRLADIYFAEGNAEAARQKYTQVVRLYRLQGERERAAEVLSRLVEEYPEDAAFCGELAAIFLEGGDLDQAVEQMMCVAESYLARGDASSAVNYLGKMLRLAPNNVDVNVRLAEMAAALGQVSEAKAAFLRGLEVEPENHDVLLRFVLYSATNESWSAEQPHLERFFDDIADDRAFALKVIEEFSAALVGASDRRELKLCLGVSLRASGRLEYAERLLREAIGGGGYVELAAKYYLASVLVEKDAPNEALKHLEAWPGIHTLQNGTSLGSGDMGKAGFASRLELDRLDLMKRIYEGLGNQNALLTVLNQIVDASPDDERAYVELVEGYFKASQLESSVQELDRLSRLLRLRGDRQRSITVYRDLVERIPGNVVVRRRLAEAYESMGSIQAAVEQLEIAVEAELASGLENEAAEDIRRLIGLYRSSEPKKLLAARQQLARLASDDISCRRELIAEYARMGLPSEALSYAEALGRELIAQRKHEDAIGVLQSMLQLDPWNVWALEQLGDLLAATARYEESAKVYQQLLSLQPRNRPQRSRATSPQG